MPRPSDDEAVSFGVLGPLTVLLDGEVVAVGGPKERSSWPTCWPGRTRW